MGLYFIEKTIVPFEILKSFVENISNITDFR